MKTSIVFGSLLMSVCATDAQSLADLDKSMGVQGLKLGSHEAALDPDHLKRRHGMNDGSVIVDLENFDVKLFGGTVQAESLTYEHGELVTIFIQFTGDVDSLKPGLIQAFGKPSSESPAITRWVGVACTLALLRNGNTASLQFQKTTAK